MSRQQQRAPKQTHASKTREAFYALTLDWIDLNRRLPMPARTDHIMRRASKEYGHPAEWASDKAAQIAGILWSWHDMMAEHRNEHRPPENTCETVRVVNAWRYLEPRFDALCELVDDDAYVEARDIHYGIERTLGKNNPVQTLPVLCPGIDCGLKTLQRRIAVGNDLVVCASCGYTVRDDEKGENYRWLVRVCLNAFLDQQIQVEQDTARVDLTTANYTSVISAVGRTMPTPQTQTIP